MPIKQDSFVLYGRVCVVAQSTSVQFDNFCNGHLVRIVPLWPPLFRSFVDRFCTKRIKRIQRLPIVLDVNLLTFRCVPRPPTEITLRVLCSCLYRVIQVMKLSPYFPRSRRGVKRYIPMELSLSRVRRLSSRAEVHSPPVMTSSADFGLEKPDFKPERRTIGVPLTTFNIISSIKM